MKTNGRITYERAWHVLTTFFKFGPLAANFDKNVLIFCVFFFKPALSSFKNLFSLMKTSLNYVLIALLPKNSKYRQILILCFLMFFDDFFKSSKAIFLYNFSNIQQSFPNSTSIFRLSFSVQWWTPRMQVWRKPFITSQEQTPKDFQWAGFILGSISL